MCLYIHKWINAIKLLYISVWRDHVYSSTLGVHTWYQLVFEGVWLNGHRRGNWIQRLEFKFWTRIGLFHYWAKVKAWLNLFHQVIGKQWYRPCPLFFIWKTLKRKENSEFKHWCGWGLNSNTYLQWTPKVSSQVNLFLVNVI